MKNKLLTTFSILTIALTNYSCSKNDDQEINTTITKKQVIENYANIAFANYTDAYNDVVTLEIAITNFTTNPTLANLNIAKDKWKLARESYGTTEAFRFADGPIDDVNGPEGLINSWPLDENYIDYVNGASTSGIINDPTSFPTINKDIISGQNENGGEKNICTGYHAIEFLLWGQDLTTPSANLPGQRPFTDYVIGGTASNQARRAQFLNACADLLTDNLLYIVNEWKIGGNYRNTFLALNEEIALKNIYTGICTLVGAELPIERMDVALLNADQEDEHSCFSDNTHRDIILNLQGAINIYNGTYGTINGASLKTLVKQVNEESYNQTLASEILAQNKANALLTPFDLAISGGLNSTEGAKVRAAVLQIKNYNSNLLSGATKVGITVN